jgi:excinuclease UvrABC ATPase subunit
MKVFIQSGDNFGILDSGIKKESQITVNKGETSTVGTDVPPQVAQQLLNQKMEEDEQNDTNSALRQSTIETYLQQAIDQMKNDPILASTPTPDEIQLAFQNLGIY